MAALVCSNLAEAQDCPAGEIADCDGSGECWPEDWIGDSYCDGNAQEYGADLCCYQNDGGDCSQKSCIGSICGDGVCAAYESPESCPSDCQFVDCNNDGINDNEQIADGSFEDCNLNGELDFCERAETITRSVDRTPNGPDDIIEFDFTNAQNVVSEVSLELQVTGELEPKNAFVSLTLGETFLGFAFASDGLDCIPVTQEFLVPIHVWNSFDKNGTRVLSITGFNVTTDNCLEPETTIVIQLQGEGNDCDENGIWDACDPDTDQDGRPDSCDNCPDDPDKFEPGVCGCGISDIDSDDDGTPDCNDPCPTLPGDCADCSKEVILNDLGGGLWDANGNGAVEVLGDVDYIQNVLGCADYDFTDSCTPNCRPDVCDIIYSPLLDINHNFILDCAEGPDDCDDDGQSDVYEILTGQAIDCNGDGIPDDCQVADGSQPDCNDNGVPDVCDVIDGTVQDINDNMLPDVCELAEGDLNLDECVGGADLAIMLSLWGLPNPPLGDLNGDGVIDGIDIATLLSKWTTCP